MPSVMSQRADSTELLCCSRKFLQSGAVKAGLGAGTLLGNVSVSFISEATSLPSCCLDTSCPSPLWRLTLDSSPSAWLSVALQLRGPASTKQQHVYSPGRPDLRLMLTGSSSVSQIDGYDSFHYRAISAPLPRNQMNHLRPDR